MKRQIKTNLPSTTGERRWQWWRGRSDGIDAGSAGSVGSRSDVRSIETLLGVVGQVVLVIELRQVGEVSILDSQRELQTLFLQNEPTDDILPRLCPFALNLRGRTTE